MSSFVVSVFPHFLFLRYRRSRLRKKKKLISNLRNSSSCWSSPTTKIQFDLGIEDAGCSLRHLLSQPPRRCTHQSHLPRRRRVRSLLYSLLTMDLSSLSLWKFELSSSSLIFFGILGLIRGNMVDAFRTHIMQTKELGNCPVRQIGGCSFVYMRISNVYIVIVVSSNANVACGFKFVVEVGFFLLKDWFGLVSDGAEDVWFTLLLL